MLDGIREADGTLATWVSAPKAELSPRRPWNAGRIAVAGVTGALVATAIAGCSSSKPAAPVEARGLTLVASYAMSIREPSDLAIDETGTVLWTVTNNPDSVYQLDRTGKPVKSLRYAGQDLEGIAYDRSDRTLWVAEENRREIVHLDLDGNVLAVYPLGLTGEPNSGLEGICLDPTGRICLLNEKRPGLFIQLDPAVSIASVDTLTFAGDYSGLCYDPPSTSFWIVSDQSQRVYLWSRTGGITKEFALPFPKAEGVAFDPGTQQIYIVSDSENRLYVYRYTR
jgi:uncharacterized protein YjiK